MRISRALSGGLGALSLAVAAGALVWVLAWAGLPPAVVWGAAAFLGLLLALRIVVAVRGSRSRPQTFSAFEDNALGRPATQVFRPPFHRDLDFEPDEAPLAWAAPIMQVAGGWREVLRGGSVEFLGRTKVSDGENALVLTSRRLMFLMIGPRELQDFGGSGLVKLLDGLPGRAGEKRRMLWQKDSGETLRALEGLLAQGGLEEIQGRVYSFTIPLSALKSFSGSIQTRSLVLGLKRRTLRYTFRDPAQLGAVSERLARLAPAAPAVAGTSKG